MFDPAHPSVLRDLLRRHGVRPRKRLGQNFLCDGNILDRVAEIACGSGQPGVVEIGAGPGALTLRLAKRASTVTAVEIDQALVSILREVVGSLPRVRIVAADFLRLEMRNLLQEAFGGTPGVVAGNIPYGITSPVLERVFQYPGAIHRAVLLVQTEVAERLVASPGTPEYGSLTVSAAFHGTVRRELNVPRHLFYPPPDVSSTLVVFEPSAEISAAVTDRDSFFRVVRAAFSQRRKTLANALTGAGLVETSREAARLLASAGIDPVRRGETLSITEFVKLGNLVASSHEGHARRNGSA